MADLKDLVNRRVPKRALKKEGEKEYTLDTRTGLEKLTFTKTPFMVSGTMQLNQTSPEIDHVIL